MEKVTNSRFSTMVLWDGGKGFVEKIMFGEALLSVFFHDGLFLF